MEGILMNIVSIDFDIIMSPCINLYADRVTEEEENSTRIWNMLEDRLEIDKFLSYDAKILTDIAWLIGKAKAAGKSVFILDSEKEIVDRIIPTIDNKECTLTHIDFFADAGTEQNKEGFDFDKYTASSWIGYLACKYGDKLPIRWLKAGNSQRVPLPATVGVLPVFDIRRIFEDIDGQVDAIFLCKNDTYVPYKYEHLFRLLEIIGGNL